MDPEDASRKAYPNGLGIEFVEPVIVKGNIDGALKSLKLYTRSLIDASIVLILRMATCTMIKIMKGYMPCTMT